MDAETLDAVKQSAGQMVDSKSYLGKEVFSTLAPVAGSGIDWDLIVQVEREEALAASDDAKIMSAIAVAMFVLMLTFVAAVWAGAFIRPVRVLSLRLQSLSGEEARPGSSPELDKERTSTTREFAGLTNTINVMLEGLTRREREAELLEAEKRSVVRRFLPDQIARQLESGDGSIEQVEHATVVAVVIGGIGGLVGSDVREVARGHVERMIDALDDAARGNGLRRVKVVGDVWIAVCGLESPRVDHVARSIRLAIDATEPMVGLDEDDGALDASVGVATGPVSAGLAGSGRLVFDAWGPTVSTAYLLARTAPPGTILVSGAAARQLPADITATELGGGDASESVWRINRTPIDTGVGR
jgi:class 3 adenylate cyclase